MEGPSLLSSPLVRAQPGQKLGKPSLLGLGFAYSTLAVRTLFGQLEVLGAL